MTPEERWQKVKDLCHLALEREPAQRIDFLADACPDDESLRREVESLIARETTSQGIISGPIWAELRAEAVDAIALPTENERLVPPTLGPYRIVRVIGEGGMGIVYEAEQDHPRRIVALKVIKPGLASPELLRRFERESGALARLHHPGIGQIYEAAAGTGLGAQPYFAMEFVRGLPLIEYAESHRLSTPLRLELMAKVCEAAQHAHQNGIIHRDLKPGNILVEETGQPKILDFGVAKVTDSDSQATKQTDLGQLVGTLVYMSPEQVTADPLQLDERTDVYSLGVILYELLSKRLPYQLSPHLHEAIRTIQEEEPKLLSSISRVYRGDVETIVAKALEKDKERRYSSAAALAGDIRRYLADEPISARPRSLNYRLQKFTQRHKVLVTATSIVFMVLVSGIVIVAIEAVRARRAEQTAEAVTNFLQNDLLAQASAATQSGPGAKPDPDLKVRAVLDRAAVRLKGQFEKQPEVEAAIRDTIGQTYLDLGLYPEARAQFNLALELYRRSLGGSNPKTLRTISRLARVISLQGVYPEAEALFKQSLDGQRALGLEQRDTLYSMTNLANVYYFEGKYPQAEALQSQALDLERRVLGPEHPSTINSTNGLANVYYHQGKYAQAERLYSHNLDVQRRLMGVEHPSTLTSMNNLAEVYRAQGKYMQAERLDGQNLEIQRRVLGPEHPDTLRSMSNLADVYLQEGKYEQADALYTKTVVIQTRVLGHEHRDTLLSMDNLAETYAFSGRYNESEKLFSKTVDVSRRILGPEHSLTLAFLSDFANMYQREGKYALAQNYAAEALTGQRRVLGSLHTDTMASAADLALAYISESKFAEGEPLAREALEFNRKEQPEDWQRYRAECLLGAVLTGEKKYAEAEPLLLDGYREMITRKEQIGVPDWYHLDRAHNWIVELYDGWGKGEKAAEWRNK